MQETIKLNANDEKLLRRIFDAVANKKIDKRIKAFVFNLALSTSVKLKDLEKLEKIMTRIPSIDESKFLLMELRFLIQSQIRRRKISFDGDDFYDINNSESRSMYNL